MGAELVDVTTGTGHRPRRPQLLTQEPVMAKARARIVFDDMPHLWTATDLDGGDIRLAADEDGNEIVFAGAPDYLAPILAGLLRTVLAREPDLCGEVAGILGLHHDPQTCRSCRELGVNRVLVEASR